MFETRRPAPLLYCGLLAAATAGVFAVFSSADATVPSRRPNRPAAGRNIEARSTAPVVAAGLRFVVAPSGNEVRYRVREQLARMPLPNDAIGKTTEIGGGISFAPDGSVIASESKFLINIGSLESDREMRDNYVRRRVLETDQYPQAEFVPTAVRGLPSPLPASGSHTFELLGNLTVHGVTKPTTWAVTAKSETDQVTGSASTFFTFADFGLQQPRVPIVLSVGDTIRLEYDFTLIPKGN